MADRKKVLSWLEGLTFDDWRMYRSDAEVQNIAKEAFELLKESVKIIRCKDCKHYSCRCCHLFDGLTLPSPDDFCSYAERREENDKR